MTFQIEHETSGTATNTDTISWSHTCGSSANKLVVAIFFEDTAGSSPVVSSMTYNSDPMTQSNAVIYYNWAGDNYNVVEFWFIDNPDTGSSYTIEATLSESVDSTGTNIMGYAWSIEDAATGDTGGWGSTSGNVQDCGISITTNDNGSLVLAAGSTRYSSMTEGSGVTEDYEVDGGAMMGWAGHHDRGYRSRFSGRTQGRRRSQNDGHAQHG